MIMVRHIKVSIVKGHVPAVVIGAGVNEHTVRAAYAGFFVQNAALPVLALPAVGCDVGFPLIASSKIMSQEILRVAREAATDSILKEIVITLPTDDMLRLFEKQVFGYLRHIMEDLAWGPYVTTDIIIEVGEGIILIERTNPPFGWALPGGFVDRGESLETAARREAKEETGMDLEDLKQFHIYSDPSRDPRFHTVTTVFTAKGIGNPQAGDDAQALRIIPFTALRTTPCAFDHNNVIDDYLKSLGR